MDRVHVDTLQAVQLRLRQLLESYNIFLSKLSGGTSWADVMDQYNGLLVRYQAIAQEMQAPVLRGMAVFPHAVLRDPSVLTDVLLRTKLAPELEAKLRAPEEPARLEPGIEQLAARHDGKVDAMQRVWERLSEETTLKSRIDVAAEDDAFMRNDDYELDDDDAELLAADNDEDDDDDDVLDDDDDDKDENDLAGSSAHQIRKRKHSGDDSDEDARVAETGGQRAGAPHPPRTPTKNAPPDEEVF